MGLKPIPLTIQVSGLPSRPLTPPLPWHSYPRALYRLQSKDLDLYVLPSTVNLFSKSVHLSGTSVQTHLHVEILLSDLWTPPSSHICILRKPSTHLPRWHLMVCPFYIAMKRVGSGHEKQKGSN